MAEIFSGVLVLLLRNTLCVTTQSESLRFAKRPFILQFGGVIVQKTFAHPQSSLGALDQIFLQNKGRNAVFMGQPKALDFSTNDSFSPSVLRTGPACVTGVSREAVCFPRGPPLSACDLRRERLNGLREPVLSEKWPRG
ncbi:hypothetical protein CEXT_188331 [Caerostris extrusa]|uniref:Uncharacterized protein n=1 Tax=Caerostris extrusa TaxID=172846 RepID=A0AAV4TEY2_CAEEX|nr:hypothetical protein CEXT_188331 [Caerostris extrusa]